MRMTRMTAGVLGGLGLCAVAGWAGVLYAQNALAALGMQEPAAKRDIVYAFNSGRVNTYPARQAFKSAAPAARAALAKTFLAWARAYTETPAFKADYDRERAANAPKPPKKRNVDEELARQKAEQAKAIADARKNLANMPANLRPQMETMVKQMEEQAAQRDADPQMAAMMRQGLQMQIADEQKRYDEAVAHHDKAYPADARLLIAERLRQFLDVSKDVDYGARLVTVNGRSRFENPAYESRSSEWKLCYRTGKDAVDAARQFAQAWLSALPAR